ncbi:hypothetical protein [Caenispirillum salinarum]|uniref:hypothetical protein n=1 Tax=Caenispirillum salinarum TaxID=859058 RepID=UPI003850609A
MPLDYHSDTLSDPVFSDASVPARKPRNTRPPSRFWTDEELASRLGKSPTWLRQNRRYLESQGMPRRDELFGYDSVAIEHWLDVRAGLREPPLEDETQKALELIRAGKP